MTTLMLASTTGPARACQEGCGAVNQELAFVALPNQWGRA
jgi:hypothetical protein